MEKLQSELSQLKQSSESDVAGVKSLQEKLDQLQAEYDNLYHDK
jgi:phage shock protein A